MLNADSGPLKGYNSTLKTTMDSKARLCQKTGFGCQTIMLLYSRTYLQSSQYIFQITRQPTPD